MATNEQKLKSYLAKRHAMIVNYAICKRTHSNQQAIAGHALTAVTAAVLKLETKLHGAAE
jgi:hypothetical protein